MNINLIRLGGVTRALNRIAVAIERHNELQELDLQDRGLTTRIVSVPDKELRDTQIEYPDPMFEQLIERLESEGHRVTDDDRAQIRAELDRIDNEEAG